MKKCLKCGRDNFDSKINCDWCGAKLPNLNDCELLFFLQQNSSLFTIAALFAALSYYLNSLLSNPSSEYGSLLNQTINVTNIQNQQYIQEVANRVFSLQISVVFSYVVFAIIILVIIYDAFSHYGFITKVFSMLLGLLLYFSLSYFYSTFHDAFYELINFISIFVIIMFFVELTEIIKEKKNRDEHFPSGLWCYIIIDCSLILSYILWTLLLIISKEPFQEMTQILNFFFVFFSWIGVVSGIVIMFIYTISDAIRH